MSSDGGQTFQFVDPTTAFPDPPGQQFCCDQVVHYIKKIDTFVWLLQYSEDASGNNVERLAFATTAQVTQGQWRIFDISSQGIGFPGLFLDYPDIAIGTNMLYVTMNGFRGNGWERTVIVRIPLAGIKSGSITAQTFTTQGNFNFRVAQFCRTTAYWASHNTNSQIRVFKWRESSATATIKDVDVATWEEGNYSSTTPDGRNWLQRADGRMTGATLSNGELWFAWTSNKGGANNRPQPYVQIARLKASTLALLENLSLWDPSSGIAFAALSTNTNKEVGVSYSIGGGARFPSHVVGILTGPAGKSRRLPARAVHRTTNGAITFACGAPIRNKSSSPRRGSRCKAARDSATLRLASPRSGAAATCRHSLRECAARQWQRAARR